MPPPPPRKTMKHAKTVEAAGFALITNIVVSLGWAVSPLLKTRRVPDFIIGAKYEGLEAVTTNAAFEAYAGPGVIVELKASSSPLGCNFDASDTKSTTEDENGFKETIRSRQTFGDAKGDFIFFFRFSEEGTTDDWELFVAPLKGEKKPTALLERQHIRNLDILREHRLESFTKSNLSELKKMIVRAYVSKTQSIS